MTPTNDPDREWTDCRPGEISGMVNQLNSARRRKTYRQAAAVTSVVLVFALVTTGLISGWLTGRTAIPEIACVTVQELAPLYVKGQTEDGLTAQIGQHLKGCQHCREHFRKNYPAFPLPLHAARSGDSARLTLASANHLP